MPITSLPSITARLYSLFHPFLLLALGVAFFTDLVNSTEDVLLASLLPLAILQSINVVVSLPPAGTSSSLSASGSGSVTTTGGADGSIRDRRRHFQLPVARRVSTSILSLIIPFLLGTPLLYLVVILFGAPLTTHSTESLLLAAHMSLLAGTPLVYVHGMNGRVWLDVASLNRPWDGVWGGSLGVLVGAWLGAVPVPLDWDRPWQAYPITILSGAYMGYAAFSLVGRCPGVYGKRIRFNNYAEEPVVENTKKSA